MVCFIILKNSVKLQLPSLYTFFREFNFTKITLHSKHPTSKKFKIGIFFALWIEFHLEIIFSYIPNKQTKNKTIKKLWSKKKLLQKSYTTTFLVKFNFFPKILKNKYIVSSFFFRTLFLWKLNWISKIPVQCFSIHLTPPTFHHFKTKTKCSFLNVIN